ncbi:MAG: F0F1 ATP synthase subunit B [Planctomycetes bacterium]|nr:F0F1 ATP synthase subunit B [Planctomycetota bacterium]
MNRFVFLGALLIALGFLGLPASLLAADEGHGGAAPNPLEWRYDTAIWALVVFVFLLVILRAKAWDPILEGLQKREETIRESIEDAKKAREEMVKMKADFDRELAEAHQQIPKLMEEARKKAEDMTNEMRAKAAADIQAERERLRHEVETAKDQAIKEMWEQAAHLATLISAKAIGKALSDDDHRRLLDEALVEIRQSSRN